MRDEYARDFNEFAKGNIRLNHPSDAEGNRRDRPYVFAFADPVCAHIGWFVPMTTKVEKYKELNRVRIANRIEKMLLKAIDSSDAEAESPRPEKPLTAFTDDDEQSRYFRNDFFFFGMAAGREQVYLIQNMVPVPAKYVSAPYTTTAGGVHRVSINDLKIIEKKSKRAYFRAWHDYDTTKTNIKELYNKVYEPYRKIEIEPLQVYAATEDKIKIKIKCPDNPEKIQAVWINKKSVEVKDLRVTKIGKNIAEKLGLMPSSTHILTPHM